MSIRLFDIPALDAAAEAGARRRQDSLTKPRGSLGALEDIACRLAAVQGDPRPVIGKKRIVVAAADHGVVAEGVSPYPQEVTAQMVANFLRGGAAINVLARQAGAEVVVVNAGVKFDIPGGGSGVVQVGSARGTQNMARKPAMTRAQAETLIEEGARMAHQLATDGADIIATGDMGIGNTTAAAAITSVFTGRPPTEVTGRGTGLDDAGLKRKIAVIERAIALHRPDPHDPVGVLAAVGGCEIAFLAGLMLGAAERRVAMALDGFISTAAALAAHGTEPRVTDYVFACHLSAEPGHRIALDHLKLKPLLDLNMRLGEGTGAALGLQVIEAAVRLHNEMATFEEAAVSDRPVAGRSSPSTRPLRPDLNRDQDPPQADQDTASPGRRGKRKEK